MNIPLFIAVFAVISAFIYLLYRQGFAVLRRTSAVTFVFRRGKQADNVTLDSCTGWIKHAGKFREGKTYQFFLTPQLSKGNAEVTLMNGKKQPLIQLTPQSPTQKIELDAGNRYYLRWEFKDAAGKCELRWEEA